MEMEDAYIHGGGGTFSVRSELHCTEVGHELCKSVRFTESDRVSTALAETAVLIK